MKYKNISDQTISVKQSVKGSDRAISVKQSVKGSDRAISVKPGDEFVTSPVHAKAFLPQGKIERVKAATGQKSTQQSTQSKTAAKEQKETFKEPS